MNPVLEAILLPGGVPLAFAADAAAFIDAPLAGPAPGASDRDLGHFVNSIATQAASA